MNRKFQDELFDADDDPYHEEICNYLSDQTGVCALVAKEYEVVYSENERLGLVRKDKLDEYKNLVYVISR